LCFSSLEKKRHRSRCMRDGSLLWPELITATTAWLSQLHRIIFPAHLEPHTDAATTIGISSFVAISSGCSSVGHWKWNQLEPQNALQPCEPEASDQISWSGSCLLRGRSMEIPFQRRRKEPHHCRSERASWFEFGWYSNKVSVFHSTAT